MTETKHDDIATARQVIATETAALKSLEDSIGPEMISAVDTILGTQDFVIVSGVGKSGHVGRKIAATLASTGTPSFFVHPTEASHGDLGMLRKGCTLIAISNSGETRELRDMLIYAEREHIPVIAITAKRDSFLDRYGTATLLLPKAPEACPNGLAPTTSTTMTIAMGDALAVAVMARRDFKREDFGLRHPGGSLGMQLQRVNEYLSLQKGQENPIVGPSAPFTEVIEAISRGRLGAVAVAEGDGPLLGIITDGDVRRQITARDDFRDVAAEEMMSTSPVTLSPHDRVGEAVSIFKSRAISQIIVVEDERPAGMIHIKDLMGQGYF